MTLEPGEEQFGECQTEKGREEEASFKEQGKEDRCSQNDDGLLEDFFKGKKTNSLDVFSSLERKNTKD